MPKYTKRPDGRYATSTIVGRESGKIKRKFFYAQTIRELDNKIAGFKTLFDKGIYVDDKGITLEEWANKWVELYKKSKSYNTYTMYKGAVDNYIVPFLGDIRLKELKKHQGVRSSNLRWLTTLKP